jgi:hypothetical protein
LVLSLNQETVAIGFEAKPEKPFQWFWGQTTNKPSTLILRLNQETVAIGFEAKPKKPFQWF